LVAAGLGECLHHGAEGGLLVENGILKSGEAHISPPHARE